MNQSRFEERGLIHGDHTTSRGGELNNCFGDGDSGTLTTRAPTDTPERECRGHWARLSHLMDITVFHRRQLELPPLVIAALRCHMQGLLRRTRLGRGKCNGADS